MVVGGTGIAAAVPYIIDHISRSGGAAKTRTTRLRLIWSAKTNEMFERVFCDELAGTLGHEDIMTSFYCTSSKTSFSSSPSSSAAVLELSLATKEKEAGVSVLPTGEKSPSSSNLSGSSNDNAILDARAPSRDPPLPEAADGEASANTSKLATARNPVEFLSGRPNVRAIVTSEAQKAKANSSRLAVLTCGPAQMADECRQTVYEVMRRKNGLRDIEYFEEAFGW